MKRSSGDQVERLAGQCRFLATALRTQAEGYGIVRKSDAKFLEAVAEQLDAVANDITTFFAQGDPSHVRGRAWWAKRIAGFLVGGAAIVSGVNDALDLLGGSDGLGLDTTVINLANDTYGAACIVIDLPDEQLRPSTAGVEVPSPSTVEATTEGTIRPSGDLTLKVIPREDAVEAEEQRDVRVFPGAATASAEALSSTISNAASRRDTGDADSTGRASSRRRPDRRPQRAVIAAAPNTAEWIGAIAADIEAGAIEHLRPKGVRLKPMPRSLPARS